MEEEQFLFLSSRVERCQLLTDDAHDLRSSTHPANLAMVTLRCFLEEFLVLRHLLVIWE